MIVIDKYTLKRIIGEDEYAENAINLLLKHSEKGLISSENDNIDIETALVLEHFRLALPVNAINGSLSWKSRIMPLNSVFYLEVPYIVREIFKEIGKNGRAVFEEVVENYFKKIGEKRPKDFVAITFDILEESTNLLVCGDSIVKISERFDRDGGVVISEMKGAGIISPFSGCGKTLTSFEISASPVYEVNRFIFEVVKN